MIPRSWLFAPGDAPAKMLKACGTGVDAVILDLEDSVALSKKAEARGLTAEFLAAEAEGPRPALWARVNPLNTEWTFEDLEAVVGPGLAGIVLPKANSVGDVLTVAGRLERLERDRGLEAGAIPILPLVTETPQALFTVGGYGAARERLAGLTWGAEDLSAAVGALSARDEQGLLTAPYQLARSLCLFGASAAGVPAVETVYPAFRDLEGLAAYAARGRRDGFVGMMAIHPAQVEVINRAFSPTEQEIEQAQRIVDLFAANPGAGTLGLDGQMLDKPHLVQAERTLQRARAIAER